MRKKIRDLGGGWAQLHCDLRAFGIGYVYYAVYFNRLYRPGEPYVHPPTLMKTSYLEHPDIDCVPADFLKDDYCVRCMIIEKKPKLWHDDADPDVMTEAERERWEGEVGGPFDIGVSIPVFDANGDVCGGFGLAAAGLCQQEFAQVWERDCRAITDVVTTFDARYRGHVAAESFKLSEREIEVLGYAANGATSKELALLLDLSPKTVEAYLNSVRRKTLSKNTTEAVAKAVYFHLI